MIAPRKVRLISNTLKGMTVAEAQAQLILRPQRSADALLKLLNSAVASAKHNQQIAANQLVVKSITVDPAPVLKRSLPRAQGRATSIFKRMSHVTITLEEMPAVKNARFVIAEPEKKKKTEDEKPKKATRAAGKAEQHQDLEHSRPEKKTGETAKELAVKDNQQGKQASKGFVKRIFNRKSV